jgi:aminoglycoside 3-N-acetyltransferase
LNAYVLLLGVGHGNNTSLHLAEYRATYSSKKVVQQGAPIFVNNQRVWQTFEDIETDDDDFETIGAAFAEETGLERTGKMGLADSRLVPQRNLVDFAVTWMKKNRK